MKAKSGKTDEEGNAFNYILVPKFSTGLTYKTYGTVYMADAYTNYSADYPDNGIYADNSLFICAAYSISTQELISQLAYEKFVPNN